MLSSVGRVAVQRLASKPLGISCRRVVVYRLVAYKESSFDWSVTNLGRTFATKTAPKSASANKTTKATATAKKPAAKKPATKKKAASASKKPAAKKKPAKKAAAKKKPVKRASKVAPERRAEINAKKERIELKKKSLYSEEPKGMAVDTYRVFVAEQLRGTKSLDESREAMGKMRSMFDSLSSAERQRLEAQAEQNKNTVTATYKAWVETYTPDQINEANHARRLLKKKYDVPKRKLSVRIIKDERQPKKPCTPLAYYVQSRFAAGVHTRGTPVTDSIKVIAAEWKALPDAQKTPFFNLSASDKLRYAKELEVMKQKVAT